ncbi:hypothetical protein M413DRAFT_32410 [Hebeloma cylindrosporum]|uniref:F-box domain-containing protein n=1 Tax=Hebeloma cylindrosporum TaxID=76867 RepID=A0A0C3BFJ2_HEBCY|nr:hypothetical protein M413DRAFT_32410 [Hebeloma cylindrosporum h7]
MSSGIIGLLDALHARLRLGKETVTSGAELDELYEYIRRVREILQLLEERRNTAVPINRLPTEILTSIFESLQDHHKFDDLFPAATEYELSMSHSWQVVTRICRHWRSVALSTPVLWKNLYTKTICASPRYGGWNHDIPIAFMRRSFPTSLRLSCNAHVFSAGPGDTEEPDVFYEALRENVERMESFHIASFPFLDNTVLDVLDLPLPRLWSLHLRVVNTREPTRDPDTGFITSEAYADDLELPRMFGGGASQYLRKFSLWNYTCWPENTFPKLTHLSLHEQLATPTLEEFLDTLEQSPCLEVLHLERAGPEIPHRTSTLPTRQIALPHLRQAHFLVFDPNPMNFQHRILECITTSPFVEILFSLRHSGKGDLYRLLPGFPFCDNVTDITFISSFDDNPCAAVKLDSTTKLMIQTNAEAMKSYLPFLGAQFPRLSHLLFHNSLECLPWYHSGQLRNLSSLTTITISGDVRFADIPTLLHLLEDVSEFDSSSSSSVSGEVLCPNLERIMIYASDLNSEGYIRLGAGMSVVSLEKNPVRVVHRKPDKEFEVHVFEEQGEVPVLDTYLTHLSLSDAYHLIHADAVSLTELPVLVQRL